MGSKLCEGVVVMSELQHVSTGARVGGGGVVGASSVSLWLLLKFRFW